MLDYRLHVFRAVAESLNFTQAAGALHISQPAVTRHIKVLEAHYGVALLRRSPSGVTLTRPARTLLDYTLRVAALQRLFEARVRARQPRLTGMLRLGASTTIAQYFLPTALGRFRKRHPGVEITLRTGNTDEIAALAATGRIDLGLVEGPVGRAGLRTEAFMEDEIVCLAAADHPLAKAGTIAPAALGEATFVLREPGSGTRNVVERALKAIGLKPARFAVALECESTETIKGLIENGMGVGFISRLAVRHELGDGRLVVVKVAGLAIRREFTLLYPQGPRPPGPAGVLAAFLDDASSSVRRP